jgi:ribonuclease HII
MNEIESEVFKKYKVKYIAGIDEVGRGPLAGPVVAAAVIFPKGYDNSEINDSKKLSAKKRKTLVEIIKKDALAWAISEVSHETIDKLNIYEATKKAMINAVLSLKIKPDFLLIDHMRLNLNIYQYSIKKGDEKSVSIAAASILAKEYRDELMVEYSKIYPGYGFETNMGYGTKKHLEAIENKGICKIHRKTFSPIKEKLEITLF